ncbi:nitrogen fixation protein NifQ [Mangrovimicrobium sediminis]|uniref:Nitrogen fixation protein NifQ n=1 Tax=Mangrovimicrobium sediminis TaxID=2562682 RepID=A0A4Z0M6F2_9GAMM|nr:nitrogen fixation protein NifQ [Haliea sp. SAOS-164]TGD75074.1 nitrogen fixation protein NifQ [Haliea sp. SAOS-164]
MTAQVPARAAPAPNHQARLLAELLHAQRAGRGALPNFLGLQPLVFLWLVESELQHAERAAALSPGPESPAWERGQLRQELLEMRRDEWQDLRELLLAHRAGEHPLEVAMADIVAAGCLGGEHLWRDLGLPSRAVLGELMQLFFPALATKNSADMKWKKFFYKQLCEQEGGYVCRAPSCEECAAYDDCFGPEL